MRDGRESCWDADENNVVFLTKRSMSYIMRHFLLGATFFHGATFYKICGISYKMPHLIENATFHTNWTCHTKCDISYRMRYFLYIAAFLTKHVIFTAFTYKITRTFVKHYICTKGAYKLNHNLNYIYFRTLLLLFSL